MFQDPALDNYLTGEQNLRFHAVASLVQPAVHGHFLRGFHSVGPRVRVPARDAGRPVSRSAIVIGKCLDGAIVSTFQGIVILAPAGLAHVPYDPILLLIVIGELLLLSSTLTAFGVMLTVLNPVRSDHLRRLPGAARSLQPPEHLARRERCPCPRPLRGTGGRSRWACRSASSL